jgi:hypothetical protein
MRPNMSEGPPAANGTNIVIGRVGQACASAPLDAKTTAALVALRILLRFIIPPALLQRMTLLDLDLPRYQTG